MKAKFQRGDKVVLNESSTVQTVLAMAVMELKGVLVPVYAISHGLEVEWAMEEELDHFADGDREISE